MHQQSDTFCSMEIQRFFRYATSSVRTQTVHFCRLCRTTRHQDQLCYTQLPKGFDGTADARDKSLAEVQKQNSSQDFISSERLQYPIALAESSSKPSGIACQSGGHGNAFGSNGSLICVNVSDPRTVAVTWDGRLIFHLHNRASRPQVHGLVRRSIFVDQSP
jgi:hypothetical protein